MEYCNYKNYSHSDYVKEPSCWVKWLKQCLPFCQGWRFSSLKIIMMINGKFCEFAMKQESTYQEANPVKQVWIDNVIIWKSFL